MAADGKNHFPFSVESMNLSGMTKDAIEAIEHCMANCQRAAYHCMYQVCMNQKNKVTMFHEPHKWFNSYLDWQWLYVATSSKPRNVLKMLLFTKQIQFTTGTTVTHAVQILQKEYLFWGITDFWSTTVCIFHFELGGELSSSELCIHSVLPLVGLYTATNVQIPWRPPAAYASTSKEAKDACSGLLSTFIALSCHSVNYSN
jgi:hypothetical protein